MNKQGELPPPYEEETYDDTTPLLHGRPTRIRKRTLQLAVAALLVTYLTAGFVFFYSFHSVTKEKVPKPPVRIAVIGAGPAGISAAFSISQLAETKGIKINITIFEEKNRVGGRMVLGEMDTSRSAQKFLTLSPEDVASGNLLHNHILRERDAKLLTDSYGKNWETLRQSSSVGFFDGKKIMSPATRPVDKSDWIEWLGRLFKYGTSVWKAKKLPTGTMEGFQKFLNLEGTYDDVGDMVAISKNVGPVTKSALDRLKLNGLSQEYIRDVLGPQVRRHTGQDVDELSDLALSMALDREDQGVQTSEVGGRLTTVLSGFVNKSKAKLKFKTKVSGLKREMVEDGKESWILEYSEKRSQFGKVYEMFDKVIIAAPWNSSSLQSEIPHHDEQIQYRSQWFTFFISNATLNSTYFGNPAILPSQIVPIPSSNLPPPLVGVHEVVHLKDIARFDHAAEKYYANYLYRVVSDRKIDKATIYHMAQAADESQMLASYEEKIENAYPLLYARNDGFPHFKVTDGLWHTSVIETIGSSVDLSWIAGENIARLIAKELKEGGG